MKPWQDMLRLAFGQQKMFDRPMAGVLHFFVYAGFLLINLEILEILLDGFLGTHRILLPFFGTAYPLFISSIEALVVAVMVACVCFLVRRNIYKVERLSAPEIKGWPSLDANLILWAEIFLMLFVLLMNAADQSLQAVYPQGYPATGEFFFSGLLVPLFEGRSLFFLWLVERTTWWAHIVGIFAFALYITYSKHLHILMAFPNTYYRYLSPKGRIPAMRSVTREVRNFMGLPLETDNVETVTDSSFGASKVQDFTWKSIMDSYTCTECGRCTSVCPAHLTGKKLSPRKIVMALRDAADHQAHPRLGKQPPATNDEPTLFDVITAEEINACTTCYACVEACPVGIDPVAMIIQMRQYAAMETTQSPEAWQQMCGNVENNGAPWKFSASQRTEWTIEG